MASSPRLLELLAHALVEDVTAPSAPARLCQACATVLGADSVAVTIAATSSEDLTVATPDGLAARVVGLESLLGEGPAHIALSTGHVVATEIAGRHTDVSFAVFSDTVRTLCGPGTYFAVPIRQDGRAVGVLGAYATSHVLTHGRDGAQFLADVVGLSLLGDLASLDWSTRARVHQATGMVAAQLQVAPEDVLAVLRAHAFARSASLEDVADDVVARRLGFAYDESRVVRTQRSERP
jgi:hypothetical protein